MRASSGPAWERRPSHQVGVEGGLSEGGLRVVLRLLVHEPRRQVVRHLCSHRCGWCCTLCSESGVISAEGLQGTRKRSPRFYFYFSKVRMAV